jgi:hypothetical protein
MGETGTVRDGVRVGVRVRVRVRVRVKVRVRIKVRIRVREVFPNINCMTHGNGTPGPNPYHNL